MCTPDQSYVMFTLVAYGSVNILIEPAFKYFCQALLYHVYIVIIHCIKMTRYSHQYFWFLMGPSILWLRSLGCG